MPRFRPSWEQSLTKVEHNPKFRIFRKVELLQGPRTCTSNMEITTNEKLRLKWMEEFPKHCADIFCTVKM